MKKKLNMSIAILGTAVCVLATSTLALAEEEKPTADLSVAALSKYVWRGYELSKDSIVLQPSMTIGYKGFAANMWGNMDSDPDETMYADADDKWNETDITLSYDGSVGSFGYSVGAIYYALDGSANDTVEAYLGLSFDTFLSPSITIYRDIDSAPAWYVSASLSYSVPLSETLALDLGAQAGYYSYDDEDDMADPSDPNDAYSAFHDGLLSASVTLPVNDYLSVTPQLAYSFALSSESSDVIEAASIDGTDDSFIYGGVAMSFAF